MPSRTARTQGPRSLSVESSLLAAVEVAHRAKTLAEAREFELAARWGEAHPAAPGPTDTDTGTDPGVLFGDRPLEVAGEGAPAVSEFAISEFARAVGRSEVGGRRLIGAALEAKHRLPRLWARAMAGEVAVWKLCRITEHTHRLHPEGATQVDQCLAPVAHTCSFAEIERVAAAAAAEAEAEGEEQDRASTGPYLTIGLDDAKHNHGYVPVEGLLDLDDALALEAAIRARAHGLLTDHPDLDLHRRRAKALGLLADDTHAGTDESGGGRELVIYTHHDTRDTHGIVGVEGVSSTGSWVTIEQLTEWCQHANTRVSIRPVLDLDEELATDSYTPSARQREQAILTCPTCVFPGCGRSSRHADLDHIRPWARGGRSVSWNLAPLCRLHHRLKTHGAWTYTRLSRTCFIWTSPEGRAYLNDLTGKRRRTH